MIVSSACAAFVRSPLQGRGERIGLINGPLQDRGGLPRIIPIFPRMFAKWLAGTTVHWGGCSLLIQDHELRAKAVHGDIVGTNLLNWPLTLAELEPYYDKAEDKMGVTGTHGIPLLDADNNQIVMVAGAKKGWLQGMLHRQYGYQLTSTRRFRMGSVFKEFAPMRSGRRLFGRLDGVINNAGRAYRAPASATSLEEFRSLLEINLLAAFALAEAAYEELPHGSRRSPLSDPGRSLWSPLSHCS
jgi:choline dehydrogenase-like flavoprotein